MRGSTVLAPQQAPTAVFYALCPDLKFILDGDFSMHRSGFLGSGQKSATGNKRYGLQGL